VNRLKVRVADASQAGDDNVVFSSGEDSTPPTLSPRTNGGSVAVTGLANIAVKVADLDAACAFYRAAGADVRDRMAWENGERADVHLGPVMITLFTRAIYEDAVDLPAEGFLHPALFTDDLDAELEGHTVVWGPAVVEGTFGKRRIAFVEAPGGIRLEFMEQLAE
jgi:catechol 2,3-dioxygenase-like lactoylglutathione lyase family enzyme